MNNPAKILVVDDVEKNVKLLADILFASGYEVLKASSGKEALDIIEKQHVDIVLLDILMPGMDGYEVCRAIRDNPATEVLPVVLVTALDPSEERVKGIEAGADDFLTKPVNRPELLARVRSLLRIKDLHDKVQEQTSELESWSQELEGRVKSQVEELEKLGELKRFLTPQVVDLLTTDGIDPHKPHRRKISVVFLDLRGFTALTSSAEPEEVMDILNEYHEAMGALVSKYHGTLVHFIGDGIMIIFNDPISIEKPAETAVRMTLEMRESAMEICDKWRRQGFDLGCGFGIDEGYATIGAVGYEGRMDYTAIGTVTNLSSRLCGEAKDGQILMTQKTFSQMENIAQAESLGEMEYKGIPAPLVTYNILSIADESG
jgi:class 3 adenylate cyclase